MVADAAARQVDYLIDYDHQSLSPTAAARAAGWFRALTWKPDGLYVADPKWTDAARAMIAANEYRFISPVFTYDPTTLEVQSLKSIALTNTPALPQLTDLSQVALRLAAPPMLGPSGLPREGQSIDALREAISATQSSMHFRRVFGRSLD